MQCVYLYILTNTYAFVFLKHVTRAAIQSEVVELHTLLHKFVLYTNVIYFIINLKYVKKHDNFFLKLPSFVAWCKCGAMSLQRSINENKNHRQPFHIRYYEFCDNALVFHISDNKYGKLLKYGNIRA